MAVGTLEPQFFLQLLSILNLPLDSSPTPELREQIADKFRQHDKKYWTEIFRETDCCVTPVLTLQEAWERNRYAHTAGPGVWPRLLHSDGSPLTQPPDSQENRRASPRVGQDTYTVLRDAGIADGDIHTMARDGVIHMSHDPLYPPPKSNL